MNEIERVAQMVADGRITADEADRLIAVLRSEQVTDEPASAEPRPERSSAAGSADPPATARAPLPPVAVEPSPARPTRPEAPGPVAERPEANAPGNAARAPGCAPAGTRWVRVDHFVGDLEVKVDPSLSAPSGTCEHGDLSFEQTADGYRVAVDGSGGTLGAWLGNIRRGPLKLVVPSGYGVELAKTAGDIELEGVPYLKGSLAAGDVEARGLLGVDLDTLAGDVSFALELTEGRHRVRAKAGEISIVLLPGSDVKVVGEAKLGSVTARPPFTATRDLMGGRLSGTLGSGRATLELNVKAGSIGVRSEERHE